MIITNGSSGSNNKPVQVQGSSNEYGFFSAMSRCATAVITSTAYQAGAVIASNFLEQKDIRDYTLQSNYHMRMANGTWKAYLLFGDDLICPAMNCPRSEELSALYQESGTENAKSAIGDILASNKKRFRLIEDEKKPEYLNERRTSFKGVCFAQTVKFISDILKFTGEITPAVLKSLSEQYSDGSDASIVRMNRIQECKYEYVRNDESCNLINADDQSVDFKALFEACREIFWNFNSSSTPQVLIADLFDLIYNEIKSSEFCYSGNKINDENNKIMSFCDVLPAGSDRCYEISTFNSKKKGESGHAIAYIKLSNDERYLRDPNLGLVRIPKGKDAEYIKLCLDNIEQDSFCFIEYKLMYNKYQNK